MDIIEAIKHEWRQNPELCVGVVALGLIVGIIVVMTKPPSPPSHNYWIQECAQMRPLVECREDAESLFGGSE